MEHLTTAALRDLLEVGVALTSEVRLDRLLDIVLDRARKIIDADAGTLYVKEGKKLRFAASQNDTLQTRVSATERGNPLLNMLIPISTKSLSGYAAATGEIVRIDDAYEIPKSAPYGFDRSFDKKNNYRTRSVLCVPLKDRAGHVVGVLQLINNYDKQGKVVPFSEFHVALVRSFASQAAVALTNSQLTEDLLDSYYDTVNRLAVVAEYKDKSTALHISRMGQYAQVLAYQLGFSQDDAERLLYAAPMHDIGKVGIPDAILMKPGMLTKPERKIIQTHPEIAGKILAASKSELIRTSRVVALTHHEKWDGSGYPRGLKGKKIPLVGRIAALTDVFDALSTARCYKDAFDIDRVLGIMRSEKGKHFCPTVSEAFESSLGEILEIYDKLYVKAEGRGTVKKKVSKKKPSKK
jgi:HD-GYP domain-containing protein (c-di-GMP phosphodiesterase class II)